MRVRSNCNPLLLRGRNTGRVFVAIIAIDMIDFGGTLGTGCIVLYCICPPPSLSHGPTIK